MPHVSEQACVVVSVDVMLSVDVMDMVWVDVVVVVTWLDGKRGPQGTQKHDPLLAAYASKIKFHVDIGRIHARALRVHLCRVSHWPNGNMILRTHAEVGLPTRSPFVGLTPCGNFAKIFAEASRDIFGRSQLFPTSSQQPAGAF